ncbi:NnrS family protein [Azospirillum doebereinerae]|uniref:NnrS family protein n=1 Tax=Azospirillum doebereinerae TaxID=92933 RepID=A0A3S0WVQ3_9PROT|nr:NnrS family protein [Azospirillum doebereinerae]RUQ72167.1 NnrS family protein [Azospirillum doebereinerae]
MKPTTMERSRNWTGPAVLSFGFRPFFFCGALYAAGLIAVWVPWFLGFINPDTAFSPVAWHAHELLFGYVPAIVAGFLMTAVPNWTGRLPVVGWPLAALFAAWAAGRLGVAGSTALGPLATALVTLLFPVALAAVMGREIVAGRNWRNLKVLGVLFVLIGAQSLFHWELWRFGQSTHGARLAVATTVTLIMLVGGRIIPSFTGNWLKKQGAARLPAPFSRFDQVAVGLGVLALAGWVARDAGLVDERLTGALLLVAGIAQAVRLARWQPHRTLAEPLVLVLHVAYAFIPAGFLLAGWASVAGSVAHGSAALHAWTAGAIGGMTLAVMTRATLGHTGRALVASWPTIAIYAAVTVAAGARIAAALAPQRTMLLMPLAGVAWIVAFLLFGVVYGRMLLTARR